MGLSSFLTVLHTSSASRGAAVAPQLLLYGSSSALGALPNSGPAVSQCRRPALAARPELCPHGPSSERRRRGALRKGDGRTAAPLPPPNFCSQTNNTPGGEREWAGKLFLLLLAQLSVHPLCPASRGAICSSYWFALTSLRWIRRPRLPPPPPRLQPLRAVCKGKTAVKRAAGRGQRGGQQAARRLAAAGRSNQYGALRLARGRRGRPGSLLALGRVLSGGS